MNENEVHSLAHQPPYHEPPAEAPVPRRRRVVTLPPPYVPRYFDLPEVEYDELANHNVVITVRLPAVSHQHLSEMAHAARTSLNMLLLSKILTPASQVEILPGKHREKLARRLWRQRNAETR